jgi:transcriptional regulator with XRE-family HTH domain
MSTNMGKKNSSTIHDKRYQNLIASIVQLRKDANISQKKLAEIIGLSQSDISKIESCERRVDVVELIDYLHAIAPNNAEQLVNSLLKDLIKA